MPKHPFSTPTNLLGCLSHGHDESVCVGTAISPPVLLWGDTTQAQSEANARIVNNWASTNLQKGTKVPCPANCTYVDLFLAGHQAALGTPAKVLVFGWIPFDTTEHAKQLPNSDYCGGSAANTLADILAFLRYPSNTAYGNQGIWIPLYNENDGIHEITLNGDVRVQIEGTPPAGLNIGSKYTVHLRGVKAIHVECTQASSAFASVLGMFGK